MVEVLDYRIVFGDNRAELEKSVMAALREGFQPQGGASCSTTPHGNFIYIQAVVKFKARWL